MSKRGIFQNVLVVTLAVVIIAMSFGYAIFDPDLDVSNGTLEIKSRTWSVNLENPISTANSTIGLDEILMRPMVGDNKDSILFNVSLGSGDSYEFAFDVRNSGDVDATLASYSLVGKKNGSDIVVLEDGSLSEIMYEVKEDERTLMRGEVATKILRIMVPESESVIKDNYEFTFNMVYEPIK